MSNLASQFTKEEAAAIVAQFQPRIVEEYFVHNPHPVQQIALSNTMPEVLFGGAVGGGKMISLTMDILTTNGWKKCGELEIGDQPFDHDGNPTTILAKSEIASVGTYRVVMSDGEQIDVHEDHRWNVSTELQRSAYGRTDPSWQAKRRANRASRSKGKESLKVGTGLSATTNNSRRAAEIREGKERPSIWDYTSTVTTLQLKELVESERSKPSIPVGAPLQGNLPWQSTIPAYTFGAWLGDGNSKDGTIYCCADDYESLSDELISDGWQISYIKWAVAGRKQPFGKITLKKDGKTLGQLLRAERLLNNKHIPEWVIRTSYADRQAFIGGLLDTDGHVDERGRIQFAMAREQMVRETNKLFWSMGIPATSVKHKITKNQNKGFVGEAWRFEVSQCPSYLFRMPRKRNKLQVRNPESQRNYKMYRTVVSVDKVDDVPMQCIKVDNPRGLYRVGQTQLVTHNSDYILMAALQYVDVPGYSALILRRTWQELIASQAVLDRFKGWMAGKDVKRREGGRIWEFPSGAKITFGYAMRSDDKLKFQGSEYQFVGFDEATLFEDEIYTFLKSRLRHPTLPCVVCTQPLQRYMDDYDVIRYRHKENKSGCKDPLPDPIALYEYTPSKKDGMTIFNVPLRMRATANPGGISHQFFKDRFIDNDTRQPGCFFIPSTLRDNPSLPREEYLEQLSGLSYVDKKRMVDGDWDVMDKGNLFERDDFQIVDYGPSESEVKSRVRFWDFAASDGKKSDWTAGALCSITHDGRWFVEDIKRVRKLPPDVEILVKQTAKADGLGVKIFAEQEPGSSGKSFISYYKRFILPGYRFAGIRSTGSKPDRAGSVVSQTAIKNIYLVKAKWNKDFLDEASTFPTSTHDDQIDAVSSAFIQQTVAKRPVRLVSSW